jgi:rhodanese-related sulfurtransferase
VEDIIIDLIREGAFLVDVRNPDEFAEGHTKGSVNIPVHDLLNNISLFEGKPSIIVFCRSGNRSEMAKSLLEAKGIQNVVNAGTWNYMDHILTTMDQE